MYKSPFIPKKTESMSIAFKIPPSTTLTVHHKMTTNSIFT